MTEDAAYGDMTLTENKKNIIFRNVIWMVIAMATAMVAALMVTSESNSLNHFYNGGSVYDVPSAYRDLESPGITYDAGTGVLRITEDIAYKSFDLSGMKKKWNYIILDISKLNKDMLEGVIDYYNKGGTCVFSQPFVLNEGRNVLQSQEVSYASVALRFEGQNGTEFSVDKAQFRQKILHISRRLFAAVFLLVFAVSVLILWFLHRLIGGRIKWYGFVELLQGIYILVGEAAGRLTEKMSSRRKSIFRICLFLFQIIYMQMVMNLQLYERDRYFKVQILVCSIIVIAIAMLCYEKKLVYCDWNNKLVGAWTVLWVMACISDFLVAKRYAFLGYMMFFAIGFFYFMWNNMEDRRQIFREFAQAVILSFVVTTAFCFLCRPSGEGLRYLGSYYSPGMYAMYVLFVWIAIWADIDIRLGKSEPFGALAAAELAGAGLAGMLLWKTQSASGVIPAAVVIGIFAWKQLFLSGSIDAAKRGLRVMLAAAVIAIPVSMAGEWGLANIPGMLGTEVQFEKDEAFEAAQISIGTETVYAAETGETTGKSRIVKKLTDFASIEEFTSARNWYWAAYLREMNLVGHENKVNMWGKNRWPHNGFLAIMYRYGVFAGIPYAVMVFLNLWYSWKYMMRNRKEYGFFLFAVSVASFILILMENLELPFAFLCWSAMYLLMGANFVSPPACHSKGNSDK